MSGSHRFKLDVPTYLRRMPPSETLIEMLHEFTARVLSGELVWR